MGLFTNPLSHTGYPPGVTGTPTTQPTAVRAATAAEVASGVLNNCYVSPSTASSLDAGLFASPPALGSTTPNAINGTTLALTSANFSLAPVVVAAGASPQIATGRICKVTFSGVSIASGASQTFTITDVAITGSSTVVAVSWFGATAGSALSIASVVNSAGSCAITMTNGTSATMVTSIANITFNIWVQN